MPADGNFPTPMKGPCSFHTPLCVMAMLVAILLSACGYKGEPVMGVKDIDTVVNDISRTAVTAGVTFMGSVAVNIRGYANESTVSDPIGVSEQGFLVSRFRNEFAYDDADMYPANSTDYVLRVPIDSVGPDNSIVTRLHGLIPFTQFYYRAYVVKDGQPQLGAVRTFKTLPMEVSIAKAPLSTGLTTVDLVGTLQSLKEDDYGEQISLWFRVQDAPFSSNDSIVPSFVQNAPSEFLYSNTERTAHFEGLIPGYDYYARAYARVESSFWVFEQDNPIVVDSREFGVNAEDLVTECFVSEELPFVARRLVGVVAHPAEKISVDFDIAEIDDAFFQLPSDTLQASEYGIAIVTIDDEGVRHYDHYKSNDELRFGNRYSYRFDNLPLDTEFRFVTYVIVKEITFYCAETQYFYTRDYTFGEVDLALPSGVLWGDRNVGSYSPEIYGQYYAWGETESKLFYHDTTFIGAGPQVMNIAGTPHDVARVKWGGNWRMPTRADFQELLDECTWKWTQQSGKSGLLIVSNVNSRSIFLPAAGLCKEDGKAVEVGSYCHYWTCERLANSLAPLGLVYDMYFTCGLMQEQDLLPEHWVAPFYGLPVRAVRDTR